MRPKGVITLPLYSSLPLTVYSYNLLEGARPNRHSPRGPQHDPRQALHRFVQRQQASGGPALWCLQETNGWADPGSTKLDEFALYADAEAFHLADASSMPSSTSSYDVSTFSPTPLVRFEEVIAGLDHAAVISHLKFKAGGMPLTVVNVHLAPSGGQRQLDELKLVMARVRGLPNVMIVGDLNCVSRLDRYDEDAVLRRLAELRVGKFGTDRLNYATTDYLAAEGFVDVGAHFSVFGSTSGSPLCLDPTHDAQLRVDYAFARPDVLRYIASFEVIKNELTDEISDHYPLKVTFDRP